MRVPALMWGMPLPLSAQNLFQHMDNVLKENYHKVKYVRPTITYGLVACFVTETEKSK